MVPNRKFAGFGLIELMVAILIGLVVIGGAAQVFYSTSQAYRAQQALSRVQEAGRFGLEMLKPELRVAARLDFCIADLEIQNLLDPTGTGYVDELFNPADAILGWNFANTSINDNYGLPANLVAGDAPGTDWVNANGNPLPAIVADLAVPGSDALLVKSAEAVEGLTGCNNNNSNNSSININFSNTNAACPPPASLTDTEMEDILPQEGLVLVTDCSSGGDLFQRTNQAGASGFAAGASGAEPGNVNNFNWSAAYGDTMQVYTVRSAVFFVGVGIDGGPSLFRMDLGRGGSAAVPEELIQGVESMQVLLGEIVDITGRIQYVEPDQVTNPINIVSISLALLVRSPDNADLETDDQTYDLLSTTIDPVDDSRLRQTFSVTVGVRNRITGV